MSQPDQVAQVAMLESMLIQLSAFITGMKATAPKEVCDAGDGLVESANKFISALKVWREKVAA